MQPTGHRRAGRVTVLLLGLAALSATALPAAYAAPGTTERVSVASDGTQADNISGRRGAPTSSADGRLVAFDSLASNLVPGDANGFDDVFVRDRATGTTQRVSVASDGTQGNNISSSPAISGDGRFVAFVSNASNLVPGDTSGVRDIFVHDRATGTTQRVSVSSSGAQGNGASGGSGATNDVATIAPAISADGRFVAFESLASNLVPGDTNGTRDVFVHDLQTATTERVSVGGNKQQANSFSNPESINGDGRFVVFTSFASNLVKGDTNQQIDVFVRDRQPGPPSGSASAATTSRPTAPAPGPTAAPTAASWCSPRRPPTSCRATPTAPTTCSSATSRRGPPNA